MPEYLVIWRIDIEAPDPQTAAREALLIQRDNKVNLATFFDVCDKDTGQTVLDVDGGQ